MEDRYSSAFDEVRASDTFKQRMVARMQELNEAEPQEHARRTVSIPRRVKKRTLTVLIAAAILLIGGTALALGISAMIGARDRAQKIGYVMQNPNQMISKPMIFDEVALGLRIRGVAEGEIREKVEQALKICGLYPMRNWPVAALSFGQKKRVTIASMLVMDPQILILDEPTAGQDYRHYTDIMEFLRGLNQQGITILMITHDMHLMLEYTPHAIVIAGGRKIGDDSAVAILTDESMAEQANLKLTSLYELAQRAELPDPQNFVQQFIDYEEACRS